MIELLVYLIILGLIWYCVDRFLLQPYAPPVIRTVVTILVIVCVLVYTTNFFGFTHIHPGSYGYGP